MEGAEDGIRRTWPLIHPVIEQSARIAIAQGDLVYRMVTESTDQPTNQHTNANFHPDPAADHRSGGPETTSADAHDSDDEETTASDAHDSDEEETTASDAHDSDDEETTSTDPSLVDVVTGSVGHAPVPAALAIAPVGLALALATIGLGGARRPSQG